MYYIDVRKFVLEIVLKKKKTNQNVYKLTFKKYTLKII